MIANIIYILGCILSVYLFVVTIEFVENYFIRKEHIRKWNAVRLSIGKNEEEY